MRCTPWMRPRGLPEWRTATNHLHPIDSSPWCPPIKQTRLQFCATEQSECNAEQKQVKNIWNATIGTETEPHLLCIWDGHSNRQPNSELVKQFCSIFVLDILEIEWNIWTQPPLEELNFPVHNTVRQLIANFPSVVLAVHRWIKNSQTTKMNRCVCHYLGGAAGRNHRRGGLEESLNMYIGLETLFDY